LVAQSVEQRPFKPLVLGSSPSQPTNFSTRPVAWVYMLRGGSGRHYIGSTTDLQRRLAEHRRGHTHTTRRLGGCAEVVAALELASPVEARALERQLKRKKNPALALELLHRRAASCR
jgi:predicted GIY-YIG superfamily endonuclease